MVQTKNYTDDTETKKSCNFRKLPRQKDAKEKKLGPKKVLNEIFKTLGELEESVKLSHSNERLIFQNELQQQIDNHCLEVELVKEKTKNEILKRLNESSVHNLHFHNGGNQSEVRYLKNKCRDLTTLLKKRSHQIFKVRAQIKDLKNENERLQSLIKTQNCRIREINNDYCETISQMKKEIEILKMELEKEKQSDSNAALRHQIKVNKKLAYNNCQLKSQISYSKSVDKFNVSTQKYSEDELFKYSSDRELSG